VIVRADRYVFGTGSVQGLMAEWERALAG
jgi:hypothetical protein